MLKDEERIAEVKRRIAKKDTDGFIREIRSVYKESRDFYEVLDFSNIIL